MTTETPVYTLPDPMPWSALAGPLAHAEDALVRLDERLRASPVREGWISRTHFTEGCAALWLEGALVHLEDLVLHDAGMDVRAPTHALIRAHAVLRVRRRIAADAPDWALSAAGLAALRGDAVRKFGPEEGRGRTGRIFRCAKWRRPGRRSRRRRLRYGPFGDNGEGRSDDLDFRICDGRCFDRARRGASSMGKAASRPRDPLVYDLDWNEDERLQAWQGVRRPDPHPAAASRRRLPLGGLGADRTAATSALARQSARRRGVARSSRKRRPISSA